MNKNTLNDQSNYFLNINFIHRLPFFLIFSSLTLEEGEGGVFGGVFDAGADSFWCIETTGGLLIESDGLEFVTLAADINAAVSAEIPSLSS